MTNKPPLVVNYDSGLWPDFEYDEEGNVDLHCQAGIIKLRRFPTGIVIAKEKCQIKPYKGRTCPWCPLSVGGKDAERKRDALLTLTGPIKNGKLGTHAVRKLLARHGREENGDDG